MAEVPQQLQKYVFKKGNKAAEGKRKSMKQWAKEYLQGLDDDERLVFLNGLDPNLVWKMAEGQPRQDITSGDEKIIQIPIYGGVSRHNSDKKSNESDEEDSSS